MFNSHGQEKTGDGGAALPAGVSLVRTLEGHPWGGVLSVAFNHRGNVLASGGVDRTAKVWEVESGAVLLILKRPAPVNSVAFHPTNDVLATGSADGAVDLWDVGINSSPRTLFNHPAGISHVAFDSTGRTLAGVGDDGSTTFWDLTTNKPRLTLPEWSSAGSIDRPYAQAGGTRLRLLQRVRREGPVSSKHRAHSVGPRRAGAVGCATARRRAAALFEQAVFRLRTHVTEQSKSC